jgi:signal transduction histidine kinase
MLGRLEVATRQLDSTLEAQRQFVAEASHQLRTPLTSLEGNVQLLARLCAEDCPAAAVGLHQEILTDLDQETDRMARVVNNLLALARADAQQHLVLRPLELEPLMREAFRTARALSESVTVRLEDVPLDVRINADRDRFVELLTILLDNAVRYSPPDGEVVLRALADDSQVRVEVADNGPGIDPDERVRIFERFYRARATSSVEGAGLGLAVARWIAAEHRARLTVIDNVPSGSVFQVWMERS